LHPTAS